MSILHLRKEANSINQDANSAKAMEEIKQDVIDHLNIMLKGDFEDLSLSELIDLEISLQKLSNKIIS